MTSEELKIEAAHYRGIVIGILYTVAFFVLMAILCIFTGW